MVASPDGADLVVVNTCGFIGDARAESYEVIEEMLRLKERGRLGKVIVAGCLAERDRETLLEKYPKIDQLIGVFARDEIVVAAKCCGAGVSPASAEQEKGDSPRLCEAPFGPFRQMGTVPFGRRPATLCPIAADYDSRCHIWRT